MKISEREKFLKENPHIQPIVSAPSIVSGTSLSSSGRVPSGFNDVLSKIAEKHPNSAVADKVGGRGIKEAKTREIVKKHVDRVTKRLQNS